MKTQDPSLLCPGDVFKLENREFSPFMRRGDGCRWVGSQDTQGPGEAGVNGKSEQRESPGSEQSVGGKSGATGLSLGSRSKDHSDPHAPQPLAPQE